MKITLLHYKIGLGFLNSKYLITSFYFREFSKEKEKAQSRGDFQRLRAQQQLEEDLQVDTKYILIHLFVLAFLFMVYKRLRQPIVYLSFMKKK